VDAAAIAFGQGISVSAVQLLCAVAAIANGGTLMKPYIVQAVSERNGRLVSRFAPKAIGRAVSAQTSMTLRRVMESVIGGGTGRRAALDGYTAGGKTGTAQKPDPIGSYSKDRYIASFVGFAPVERPAIAVVVTIDEPKTAHYGGVVAAPVFRQIAERTLHYLNVGPQGKADRLRASLPGETEG
jgi:cell division protein FtsI (penicillin-binding protein 3)